MKQNLLHNIYKKVQKDFNFFANNFLKIRTKIQSVDNFILNKEQLYINKILKHQQESTGKIKVLILKGRQVGVTTLAAARNYYFTLTNKGVKSLVLTHRQSATNNVYGMVQRFYQNSPFFLNQQRALIGM